MELDELEGYWFSLLRLNCSMSCSQLFNLKIKEKLPVFHLNLKLFINFKCVYIMFILYAFSHFREMPELYLLSLSVYFCLFIQVHFLDYQSKVLGVWSCAEDVEKFVEIPKNYQNSAAILH